MDLDLTIDLGGFSGVARLFPLPGVVLFPGAVVPLHVFEPRYRQMTEQALADDRLIAMVQTRPDADWSGPAEPSVEEVGCLGRILRHERLPDGRINLLLVGLARVRLTRELIVPTLYRQAEVEVLADVPPADPLGSPRDDLIGLFRRLATRSEGLDPDLAAMLEGEIPLGPLTDLLAHALPLSPSLKQAFLAQPDVTRRAAALAEVLGCLLGSPSPRPLRTFPPFSSN